MVSGEQNAKETLADELRSLATELAGAGRVTIQDGLIDHVVAIGEDMRNVHASGKSIEFGLDGENQLVVNADLKRYWPSGDTENQLARMAGLTLATFHRVVAVLGTGDATAMLHDSCADAGFLFRVSGQGDSLESVLPSEYEPIDHAVVLHRLLTLFTNSDFDLPQAEITSVMGREQRRARWIIRFPSLDSNIVPSGPVKIGDVVSFGIDVRNCDSDGSAPMARCFTERLSCKNGATIDHPEDFGFRKLTRRKVIEGWDSALKSFDAEFRRSTDMFAVISRRMSAAAQEEVPYPHRVLVSVLREFKVAQHLRGPIIEQFGDVELDQSISAWDFVNRITRAASSDRTSTSDHAAIHGLGGRVLALPLHRFVIGHAGVSIGHKYLRFSEDVGTWSPAPEA